MRGITPYVAALLLGAAVALLAACGGSTRGGIESADARDLKSQLQDVRERVEAGRCGELNGQLRQIDEGIDRLTADEQLKENLRDGAGQLRSQAPQECNEIRDKREPAQTTPADTTSETAPTETTTTETTTQTTPTQTTQTTPAQTTPAQTTPTQTVAPVPPPVQPEPVPPPVAEPPPVVPPPPPPPVGSGGGAEPEIP